jgi:hypothetical protein
MNNPLFYLSILFGLSMTIEGFVIIVLRKQLIPLPSRLLYWVSAGVVGKEKSTQWFAGKTTPENTRTYAFIALFFGVCLILSSFIYLQSLVS